MNIDDGCVKGGEVVVFISARFKKVTVSGDLIGISNVIEELFIR